MMRFKDKVVLITGAGRNTGVGIAELFIREGAKVCINDRTPESTNHGAKILKEKGLSGFFEIPGDISDTQQVDTMFEKMLAKFGSIDILVNNACDQGIGQIFEEMSPNDFLKVMNTNLFGTFQVSLQAARIMLKQASRGVIINMGSNVSMRAIHNRTAYVASKAGIEALSRSMAVDLGPKGIRVNVVAPGYIHTDRWKTLSPTASLRRRLNIPLGVEATMDDIAQAVAFLASDAAKNICGERLVVDGGCSAQHLPIDVDV